MISKTFYCKNCGTEKDAREVRHFTGPRRDTSAECLHICVDCYTRMKLDDFQLNMVEVLINER